MDFVHRIERQARKQGYSVSGLFRAAGLGPSLMTEYRRGTHGIRPSTWDKLMAVEPNPNPDTNPNLCIPARRRRQDRMVKSA